MTLISPSADLGEGTFSSDDFSSLRGYSLKCQVTEVYGATPPRVAFPPVTTRAIVERLAKDLEDVALELGKLVENSTPL